MNNSKQYLIQLNNQPTQAKMASFKAKKVLLIFELNQTLLYVNNTKPKFVNHYKSAIPITYHQTIDHYQISYRKGRQQFLEYFFNLNKQNIDVAVITNFDHQFAGTLIKKYFGRYYRSLLFAMATNRSIYGESDEPQKNIKIKKDLTSIYNNFPGYGQTNTFVVSSNQNLLQNYKRNDLIIPQYSPTSKMFQVDAGMYPLVKYLKGILSIQQEENIADLRQLTTAKQISAIYNRYSHNMYTDKHYS